MTTRLSSEDDLEINPFYKALQTKYRGFYQQAQDRRYLICVPQTTSIDLADITQKYVEMHLLKPSPYFQGQYLTTDRENSGTLLLEDGFITKFEGFPSKSKIKILGEETGYNNEFKTYKILLLEEPIWGQLAASAQGKKPVISQCKTLIDPLLVKLTPEDNKSFLQSFPEHKPALVQLDEKIKKFNQNYLILKNYLGDAAQKLQNIWITAFEDMVELNTHPLRHEAKFAETLSAAVESYVLNDVHAKLWPVIKQAHSNEEDLLSSKLQQIRSLEPQDLGLRKEIICPLTGAVMEFSKLDGLTTPVEKLLCLKSTLDAIDEAVNGHMQKKHPFSEDVDGPCLTSDDLIPLLLLVMSQSSCRHLASNISYLELFHWSISAKDDLGFCFVTFKAAVEYMKATDFTPKANKTETKQSPSTSRAISPSQLVASPSSEDLNKSRLDRRLERITRMLEKQDLTGNLSQLVPPPKMNNNASQRISPSKYVAPDVIHLENKKKPLGDFLSALQDDMFACSHGKQS